MAAKDLADAFKANLQAQIDKADELKSTLVQQQQDIDSMVAQAHSEGVDEGKASIQLPSPQDPAAQYTQEQMNAAVNAGQDQVRAELQPQLDQASSDKAALQSQLDSAKSDLNLAKQTQADAEAKLAADNLKIAQAQKDLA